MDLDECAIVIATSAREIAFRISNIYAEVKFAIYVFYIFDPVTIQSEDEDEQEKEEEEE